jgi:hypothetical protein
MAMLSWTMSTYEGVRSGVILNRGIWMAFVGHEALPLEGRHSNSVDAVAELELELLSRHRARAAQSKGYRRTRKIVRR